MFQFKEISEFLERRLNPVNFYYVRTMCWSASILNLVIKNKLLWMNLITKRKT